MNPLWLMNIHLYISHPRWSAHCVGAICRAGVARHRATASVVVRCRALWQRRLSRNIITYLAKPRQSHFAHLYDLIFTFCQLYIRLR